MLPTTPFTLLTVQNAKSCWGAEGMEKVRKDFGEMRKGSEDGDVGFFLVVAAEGCREIKRVERLTEYENLKAGLEDGEEVGSGVLSLFVFV